MSVIETVEQLEAIYGAVGDASTVKVADHVTPLYRIFIEKAPFAALATIGPEGIDCSPRGDLPGFVRIHDPRTLMLPDRRGNNRVDSLRNIVRDPRVSLMFLIPVQATRCGPTAVPISPSIPSCWLRSRSRARRRAASW